MGLTGSAGIPPTSAFGRSSRVNVSACSEPILFSRGGSSFTVIKRPPRVDLSKANTRQAGIRIRPPTLGWRGFVESVVTMPAASRHFAVRLSE
jgi:hypothetical protein